MYTRRKRSNSSFEYTIPISDGDRVFGIFNKKNPDILAGALSGFYHEI